jgi:hypothetical protein
MSYKGLFIIFLLTFFNLVAYTQDERIVIADYEQKPGLSGWWKDNPSISLSYEERTGYQLNQLSNSCLYIRWDSIPNDRPFAWFSDIKADTFVSEGMQDKWKSFKDKTWMSFWCRAGDGDTLMLHFLVLSKGHKSKWGSVEMIPLISRDWTFIKVKFSELKYEDWGQVIADFNLDSDEPRCFEVGLRLSGSTHKGFVEAWFDNVQLTNYEPFE